MAFEDSVAIFGDGRALPSPRPCDHFLHVSLTHPLPPVAGPRAPELDPALLRPAAPISLQGSVTPRGAPSSAQPSPEVPCIAPGRSLSDVMVAPIPNGDRFGTL